MIPILKYILVEVISFQIAGETRNASNIQCAPERSFTINLIIQIQNRKLYLGNRIRSDELQFVIFLRVEIRNTDEDHAET